MLSLDPQFLELHGVYQPVSGGDKACDALDRSTVLLGRIAGEVAGHFRPAFFVVLSLAGLVN